MCLMRAHYPRGALKHDDAVVPPPPFIYVFHVVVSFQAFFDRFVSRAPLPISVWAEDNPVLDPGCLKLKQPEDEKV